MSTPRQVLPGTTYLITRRCTQRQFWLKPSALTNQIVAFCLAWAATKTGVLIHAACAMSNHLHLVVTDVEARLPEFMHIAHMYIAKCVNASYGRWENLWASEPPSAVRLVDDYDIIDKIAYCLANPVSAGLVSQGEQWPGLRSDPKDVAGSTYIIERPTVFFGPNSSVPEQLELKFSRPNIFPQLSDAQLAELVQAEVEAHEAKARAKMTSEGCRPAGVETVLRQRPSDSPLTVEPRRELNPRIAAKNKWLRVEALQRLESFLGAYRDAYELFKQGIRDVVFPAGTYALRLRHAVAVANTG